MPDGRTQRFKTVTGKLDEPQDTLTFLPPYDSVKEQASRFYPAVFAGIETAVEYDQLLLSYAQLNGRTIRVIDEAGKELATAADVEAAPKVFLAFIDKEKPKNNFTLPVSKEPKIGYQTFDTRVFNGKDGEKLRERHIGNKVKEIRYVSP
ncbi:MAG: hypothetical protein UY50_C0022G0015 [Parcubacteria group bacterium GW2011_GWA2_49_9]|nr:MAG: hypothetical protein UY50_C0022G0015 [Parcubacteria group bacterium GW2011_GWA2_49_9]